MTLPEPRAPLTATAMLTSQAGFGVAFATIFQPIAGEASLSAKHPESASTIKQIASYQDLMSELRDAVQPELELIDARVVAPLKEYGDLLKKVRKTITKRDHKVRSVARPSALTSPAHRL